MRRYYFDFLDNDAVARDEEGMELPNLGAAQEEAARTLADMARDAARGLDDQSSALHMAIDVRDDNGPLLHVKFVFQIDRYRS